MRRGTTISLLTYILFTSFAHSPPFALLRPLCLIPVSHSPSSTSLLSVYFNGYCNGKILSSHPSGGADLCLRHHRHRRTGAPRGWRRRVRAGGLYPGQDRGGDTRARGEDRGCRSHADVRYYVSYIIYHISYIICNKYIYSTRYYCIIYRMLFACGCTLYFADGCV